MRYVALLRGINVGGKNIIRMAALKTCLEDAGLDSVATFIQSGNVLFESPEKSAAKLTKRIEDAVAAAFGIRLCVVVVTHAQLKTVVAGVPASWTRGSELRCNVAFLCASLSSTEALKRVEVNPAVDSVGGGKGVLYMSTVMSGLLKSRFPKLVGRQIYREMTIRNYSTCQKLLALMERD